MNINKDKMNQLTRIFDTREDTITTLLAGRVDAKHFKSGVLSSIARTPELLQCSPTSLYIATAHAAQMGLIPGFDQEAHFIKFRNEVKLMLGYRGLVKMAMATGDYRDIRARVVYQNDHFKLSYEPGSISHSPSLLTEPGEIIGAYAIAEKHDGSMILEWMRKDEIEKARKAGRGGNSGPWKTFYSEMARKTVLRRLCKHLPKTTKEMVYGMQVEDGKAPIVEVDLATTEGASGKSEQVEQLKGLLATNLPEVDEQEADESFGNVLLDKIKELEENGTITTDKATELTERLGSAISLNNDEELDAIEADLENLE